MTTQATGITTADDLADSPAVAEAIETILRELAQVQSSITGARPPVGELAESYESWLARQPPDLAIGICEGGDPHGRGENEADHPLDPLRPRPRDAGRARHRPCRARTARPR